MFYEQKEPLSLCLLGTLQDQLLSPLCEGELEMRDLGEFIFHWLNKRPRKRCRYVMTISIDKNPTNNNGTMLIPTKIV